MVLGGVRRLEADDGARVVEVAVTPAVARGREEDVEADGRRRRQAPLDHPRDIALAAKDGELARFDGTVRADA